MSRSFTVRVRVDHALREELFDALRIALAGPVPKSRDDLERLLEHAASDPALRSRLADAVGAVAERHGFEVEGELRDEELARFVAAALDGLVTSSPGCR